MLFTSYVLGFIALVTAAPSLRPKPAISLAGRDATIPTARGLIWTPRSLETRKKSVNSYNSLGNSSRSNIGNEEITILKLEEEILATEILIAEIELTKAIKEELRLKKELQRAIDNIRKNTLRNQNNGNAEIVIVVITEIVDNRNSNKSNKRYMSRQIQNNKDDNSGEKGGKNNNNNNNNNVDVEVVFVVIVESAQMTIGSNVSKTKGRASKTDGVAKPTGTGQASPLVGTYVPGAALVKQEGISILPAGSESPKYSNGKQSSDPARIILDNQALFVDESGKSKAFDVTLLTEISISN